MIERRAIRLLIEPADRFNVSGPAADRSRAFAQRWAEFHRVELPRCRIDLQEIGAEHAGLGTGTQLGLSVAAGLSAFIGLPSQSPQELAISVGRGLRSAVGTYGFVFGGLIVEQGKLASEPISPLDCRIDLPDDWRFVLDRPRDLSGLAGEEEAIAFTALPPTAPQVQGGKLRGLAVTAAKRSSALPDVPPAITACNRGSLEIVDIEF